MEKERMKYYKVIVGNGRTYVTSHDLEFDIITTIHKWVVVKTVDGKKVWINLDNIASIEVMDEYIEEPSETQQIVNATINAFMGLDAKKVETIKLDEEERKE